jgi:N-acetyltransferase 10
VVAPALPIAQELYSVDRDALFSYTSLRSLLAKIMGLYTSVTTRIPPNVDLLMLSDAQPSSVFCLVVAIGGTRREFASDVSLAVVQVALGRDFTKGSRSSACVSSRSGDLIPWTISQQFGDSKFAQLSGARIASPFTHRQGMGYVLRPRTLAQFYNGEMSNAIPRKATMKARGRSRERRAKENELMMSPR